MIQEKLDQSRTPQNRGHHEWTTFLTDRHVYSAPGVE